MISIVDSRLMDQISVITCALCIIMNVYRIISAECSRISIIIGCLAVMLAGKLYKQKVSEGSACARRTISDQYGVRTIHFSSFLYFFHLLYEIRFHYEQSKRPSFLWEFGVSFYLLVSVRLNDTTIRFVY